MLIHPTFNFNLLEYFEEKELLEKGESLITAIEQDDLIAYYNEKPILNREDYFNLIRTYSKEELIEKLKVYREFAWEKGITEKDLQTWITENL